MTSPLFVVKQPAEKSREVYPIGRGIWRRPQNSAPRCPRMPWKSAAIRLIVA
jgi:hypothetical protein